MQPTGVLCSLWKTISKLHETAENNLITRAAVRHMYDAHMLFVSEGHVKSFNGHLVICMDQAYMQSTPRARRTRPSSMASRSCLVRVSSGGLRFRLRSSSSLGWPCVVAYGPVIGVTGTVCRAMLPVLFATKRTRPPTTCCSAVCSRGRSGTVCSAASVYLCGRLPRPRPLLIGGCPRVACYHDRFAGVLTPLSF